MNSTPDPIVLQLVAKIDTALCGSERRHEIDVPEAMLAREVIADAIVRLETLHDGTLPADYDYIVLRHEDTFRRIVVSFNVELFDGRVRSPAQALEDFQDVDLPSPTPVEDDGMSNLVRLSDLASNTVIDDDDEDEEFDEDEDEEFDEDEGSERPNSISLRIPVVVNGSIKMEDLEELITERMSDVGLDVEAHIRGFDYTDQTKVMEGKALFTVLIDLVGESAADINGREVVRLKRILTEEFEGD